MKEPIWIDATDVHAFHLEMLAMFGGLAGVRDEGLLLSALSRPQHLFAYEEAELFDLAAAYALEVTKTHPFTDGNKRVGFMTAALFLEVNGLRFEAPEEEVVSLTLTLALAAGEIDQAAYAAWLKASCSVC